MVLQINLFRIPRYASYILVSNCFKNKFGLLKRDFKLVYKAKSDRARILLKNRGMEKIEKFLDEDNLVQRATVNEIQSDHDKCCKKNEETKAALISQENETAQHHTGHIDERKDKSDKTQKVAEQTNDQSKSKRQEQIMNLVILKNEISQEKFYEIKNGLVTQEDDVDEKYGETEIIDQKSDSKSKLKSETQENIHFTMEILDLGESQNIEFKLQTNETVSKLNDFLKKSPLMIGKSALKAKLCDKILNKDEENGIDKSLITEGQTLKTRLDLTNKDTSEKDRIKSVDIQEKSIYSNSYHKTAHTSIEKENSIANIDIRDIVTPLWKYPYSEQILIKQRALDHFLGKNGLKCSSAIIPFEFGNLQRNSFEFAFGYKPDGTGCLGFRGVKYVENKNMVFDPFQVDFISEDLKDKMSKIQKMLNIEKFRRLIYDRETRKGLLRMLKVKINTSNQYIAIVDIEHISDSDLVLPSEKNTVLTKETFPSEYSDIYDFIDALPFENLFLTFNKGDFEGFSTTELYTIRGASTIPQEINDYTFRIAPFGFFQCNIYILGQIIEKIISQSDPINHFLLDLCCGQMTLGILLSSHFKMVLGIENHRQSILSFYENQKRNTLSNCKILEEDVNKVSIRTLINNITESSEVRLEIDQLSGSSLRKKEKYERNVVSIEADYNSREPQNSTEGTKILNDSQNLSERQNHQEVKAKNLTQDSKNISTAKVFEISQDSERIKSSGHMEAIIFDEYAKKDQNIINIEARNQVERDKNKFSQAKIELFHSETGINNTSMNRQYDALYPEKKKNSSSFIAILDPPRAGVHKDLIKRIRKIPQIKELFFISCDYKQTIINAKDLIREESKAYGKSFKLIDTTCFDMFVGTKNLEVLFHFRR